MDHLAIMKKQWGLTQKILSGRKKIESRWYKARYSPWDKIKKGDTIYIKNTGELVSIKTEIKKVLQFSDLTPKRVMQLLSKHSGNLGIQDVPKFFQMFKDKRYCILIFLKNPQKIKPFDIDKTGFGSMAAWISVSSIQKIKTNS